MIDMIVSLIDNKSVSDYIELNWDRLFLVDVQSLI